ncbi:protein of unknown function [Kyrpidia spormannii]|uniref:Uncharacterized protein n=2 Tax=Kyrpidia spormannii TaxID=2055160 RepID=A0A6F9DZC9_9BACL|nr:protein of unknown function [Kyrpidia spormannii]CAB3390214.1 protein of unknown function [Kyrpidia spormannii]
MTRLDDTTEKTINRVVLDCEVFWILRNIPRTQVDEMKAELEQHLREAVRDGKTVTDVVGAL